jgi:hypothetical protein
LLKELWGMNLTPTAENSNGKAMLLIEKMNFKTKFTEINQVNCQNEKIETN